MLARIAIIWERDLGILHKFLAFPTPRSALVLVVLLVVILRAACFSTFSLIIACVVKTRERFMGRGRCCRYRRSSRATPSTRSK